MLDQLIQIVQQNAQTDVVENNAVPNEYNEGVMSEASNTIMDSLQQLIAQGKTDQIDALANDDQDGSQAMGFISGNFIENISQKFGIDKGAASGIAASMLPKILGSFFGKAKDPNDSSFNMQDIFSSLTSGKGSAQGNIQDTISSIGSKLGLDKDNDGDVDINDVIGMFK